jgi:hypothetical protein
MNGSETQVVAIKDTEQVNFIHTARVYGALCCKVLQICDIFALGQYFFCVHFTYKKRREYEGAGVVD